MTCHVLCRWLAGALCFGLGCGSQTPAPEAPLTDNAHPDEAEEGLLESQTSDSEAAPSDTGSKPQSSRPACTDESCLVCGAGLCPRGFFCDESNEKAGCSWLPECLTATDCKCLDKWLPSCTCREANGGVYLNCP